MFTVQPLFNTWLGQLNLSLLSLNDDQIPTFAKYPNWKCAVDEKGAVLVFQLISSTGEMRDGFYNYVVATGSRMYVAEWYPDIRINLTLSPKDQPAPSRYELLLLTSMAKLGIDALVKDAQKA
jgi:hypothetical protein